MIYIIFPEEMRRLGLDGKIQALLEPFFGFKPMVWSGFDVSSVIKIAMIFFQGKAPNQYQLDKIMAAIRAEFPQHTVIGDVATEVFDFILAPEKENEVVTY